MGHVGPSTDDLPRFREIFLAPGTPYRAFPVEYAPGEVLFIEGIGSSDLSAVATRVAIAAFIGDIAAWAAVRHGWGPGAAQRYLWIGAPLLVFLYVRFDMVPVALAAWGAALAVRRSERAAGIAFAAAILSKLWPAVLLPALFVAGRRRALAWASGLTAAGVIGWLAFAGSAGITGVITFRHASGWGIESTVGTVVWSLTGGPVRIEAGSQRVGLAPRWETILLSALLLALLVMIWSKAARRDRDPFGPPSVAAIGALLACSPLFSVQFAAWLLPWAAVSWADGDRRSFWLVASIETLTAAAFMLLGPRTVPLEQILLLCRNGLVLATVIVWLLPRMAPRSGAAV